MKTIEEEIPDDDQYLTDEDEDKGAPPNDGETYAGPSNPSTSMMAPNLPAHNPATEDMSSYPQSNLWRPQDNAEGSDLLSQGLFTFGEMLGGYFPEAP
jgi:hypothetical protein